MTEPFAHSLLKKLLGPDAPLRAGTRESIRDNAMLCADLRPFAYARLDDDPADRFQPALLVRDLYGDVAPLVRVVMDAMRSPLPDDDVRDEVLELPTLGVPKLLIECAFDRPKLFAVIFERSPRWVTRVLLSAGTPGVLTLRLFVAELLPELLYQVAGVIADEAVASPHDLSPLILPLSAVRARPQSRLEVGCALWRLTWRIDSEWVACLASLPAWNVSELMVDVLLEMLPSCPALHPVALQFFGNYSPVIADRAWCGRVVRRLVETGRGQHVLAQVDISHAVGLATFRAELLTAIADDPTLCRRFRDMAEKTLETPNAEVGPVAADAVRAACRVLAAVGPAAATAVPKLLEFVEKDEFLADIRAAVSAVGVGSATVRELLLDRIDRTLKNHLLLGASSTEVPRLAALVETLVAVEPDWLGKLLARPALSRDLLAQAYLAVADLHDDARRRALETLPPFLVSKDEEVRTEAVNWLMLGRIEPRFTRLWPRMLALVSVPLPNPALIGLFGQFADVFADIRERVDSELIPHLSDTNPVIAANAAAALAALNIEV